MIDKTGLEWRSANYDHCMVFVLASLVTEMPRNIYPRTRKEITELMAMSWLVRDGTTRENLSPTVEDAVKEMVGVLQWSYDRHQVAAAEHNKQQVKQKATAMQLVNRHNCRINTTKEVKEWWLREPPSPMKFQAMFQLLYCPLGAGNIIMKRVVDEADCNWEQERLSQYGWRHILRWHKVQHQKRPENNHLWRISWQIRCQNSRRAQETDRHPLGDA